MNSIVNLLLSTFLIFGGIQGESSKGGDSSFTNYIYLNGQRVAMEENGKKFFFHNDHLGGTNVVTDETATQVQYEEYEPYGAPEQQNTGAPVTSHLFTGKELDDSTGLYDYAARQYDPKLGRFITPDTVEPKLTNPQTLNRYSYTLNNPLRYIDPSGNVPIIPYLITLISLPDFRQDIQQLLLDAQTGDVGGMVIDAISAAVPGLSAGAAKVGKGIISRAVDAIGGAKATRGGKTFDYYLDKVGKLNVKTPKDKAVFYSGQGNYQKARNFADKTGKMLIEDTPGGKWLTNEGLYNKMPRDQANKIWETASERYAQQASGNVNIFGRGANPKNIFKKIEEPVLKNNLNVHKRTYRGYD